eukprot:gene11895-12039_t
MLVDNKRYEPIRKTAFFECHNTWFFRASGASPQTPRYMVAWPNAWVSLPTAALADQLLVRATAPLAAAGSVHTTTVYPHQCTIFFAGVAPVAPAESLITLFSQFGRVVYLNLFRPWAGSATSKGCGLAVFEHHAAAVAALNTLHGRFQWPGARSPMVVEWMDASKQGMKARSQPLGSKTQHRFQPYPAGVLPGGPMVPYVPQSNPGYFFWKLAEQ